jgi:hypothetical protein
MLKWKKIMQAAGFFSEVKKPFRLPFCRRRMFNLPFG